MCLSSENDSYEDVLRTAEPALRSGSLRDWSKWCEELTKRDPRRVDGFRRLCAVARDAGRLDVATELIRYALARHENIAELHTEAGNLCFEQDQFEAAIGHHRRAVEIAPERSDLHGCLGRAFFKADCLDEAIAQFERALELDGGSAETHHNLGESLFKKMELERAVVHYGKAVALQPASAESNYKLGRALFAQGRFGDAVQFMATANLLCADCPVAQVNEGLARLIVGDFAGGWPKYEWRKHLKDARWPRNGPLWDGRDLRRKTILLVCEQGLGDNIQFIRYAALIKQKGAYIIVSCPPALAPVFVSLKEVDQVVTDPRYLPSFDFVAPLASLPHMLNTRVDTIPADVPYIIPCEAKRTCWRKKLRHVPTPRVGLVWRGNPMHPNDRNRSIAPALFSRFLDVPGVGSVSLQKDATDEEIRELHMGGHFMNAASDLDDFSDTAALLSILDLIVTVDTSVCHLAGALGKRVWTLLPFVPDWRWMSNRDDSPWYPTMRLFRQRHHGEWDAVISTVRGELVRFSET
jgi:Flp pilus assembly protein TadD